MPALRRRTKRLQQAVWSQNAPADRATAHLNAEPQIGLEHAPVIYTRLAAHGGSIRDRADLHTI
jgi:hypothetical protein